LKTMRMCMLSMMESCSWYQFRKNGFNQQWSYWLLAATKLSS
jgi:hypothetical protein